MAKGLFSIGLASMALLAATIARGEIRLASPFTDHMVLQRDAAVPVWGTAEPGDEVVVEFAGQKVSATADAGGNWRAVLKPMKANAEASELIVTGGGAGSVETVKCGDVLVGEVWLASGQSNMDFSMSKKVKSFAGVTNEAAEIAAANYPLIRMFVGVAQKTYAPTNRVGGAWKVCTPENAPAFSAVAYFFARDLQRGTNVPVGMIVEAYGASTAEAWIDRDTMAGDEKLRPMLERFDAAVENFRTNPPAVVAAQRSEDVSATNEVAVANGAAGSTNSTAQSRRERSSARRDPVQDQHNATVLFNGMIAPIVPYAIRGVIWYQGESIVGGSAGVALYPHVQAALIGDWRRSWGDDDLPFYIVQLAGQEAASNRPEVREAQATVLQLPHTGMAVATDIGEARNVHPKDKQDVGDRLARIALANVYGQDIEFSGPVYDGMRIKGGEIHVRFSHAEGLTARGEKLKWFSIAGADGKFVAADARIEGDKVVVSSPEVAAPVAVRYAWVNFPNGGHLYNSAGLPAAQFRSDGGKIPVE